MNPFSHVGAVSLCTLCLVACGGEADDLFTTGGAGGEQAGGAGAGSSTGGSGQGASGAGGPQGGNGAGGPGGQGGPGGAGGCGPGEPLGHRPAATLVLLDQSGSMAGEHWNAVAAALPNSIGSVAANAPVGMLPFPEGEFDTDAQSNCVLTPTVPPCPALLADGGCEDVAAVPAVQLAASSVAGPAIVDYFDGVVPDGGTPTRDALSKAYDALGAFPAEGDRVALLVTDGSANVYAPANQFFPESNVACGTLDQIESEVAAALAIDGIFTAVVAINLAAEPETSTFMSEMAVAGGTEIAPGCNVQAGQCHYSAVGPNVAASLEEQLAAALRRTRGCTFDLPNGVSAGMAESVDIAVSAAGGTVIASYDPTLTEGWSFDPSAPAVRLYGAACDLFLSDWQASVTVDSCGR